MTILPNKSKKTNKADRLSSILHNGRVGVRHSSNSVDTRKHTQSSSISNMAASSVIPNLRASHKASLGYNSAATQQDCNMFMRNQQDHSNVLGNNSDDEHVPGFNDPKMEIWFEEILKKTYGWSVKIMRADGACLFRAVADQVYGDQDMHDEVRRLCLDYMEKNRDHFSQFITEDFEGYILRKRQDHVHGNHVELQAITEIFSRPIEIYQYSIEPINIFTPRNEISTTGNPNPPIRLSYHGTSHYNSVIDPYAATIGIGLGLPGHSPGSADRNLVKEAISKSESHLIDDAMLEDKIRLSDYECTEQEINQQVQMESYFEHVQKTQKNSNRCDTNIQENKKSYDSSPGCSGAKCKFEISEWSKAAQDDAEEKALLAQVMALSQQEFLNSLRKNSDSNGFDQAGSSKSS